ncbi:response regulator [Labilibacter sediminis]|nr:response regulator [Labilibacter sediminis]
MRLKEIIISFFILLFSTSTKGDDLEDLRFINLGQEAGLTQNSVSSIIQDKYGFIWIATPNGLYRHDGYNFEPFKNDPSDSCSVISNNVNNITTDSEGFIWIGTKVGLSVFNPITQNFQNPSPLLQNTINCSIEGSNNHHIVGTQNGLFLLKKNKGKVEVIKTLQNKSILDKRITCLCFDTDSNLWIGSEKGVCMLANKSYKKLIKGDDTYKYDFLENKSSAFKPIRENHIIDIKANTSNNLLIATRSQIYSIKGDSCHNTILNKKDNVRIISLSIENDSTYWVGTRNMGLFKIHNENVINYQHNPLNPYSIGSNQVNSIFKDQSNVLWIGCARGGISKLYLKQKPFKQFQFIPYKPNSLIHNQINAICEDSKQNIWVATYNKGIDLIKPTDDTHQVFHLQNYIPSLSKYQVFALNIDQYDNLWIGTNKQGLLLLTKSEIDKIFKNEEPKLIHYKSFYQDQLNLSITNISTIYQTSPNEFWLGSIKGEGLTQMTIEDQDIENPVFKRYLNRVGKANSISSNQVTTIFQDKDSVLWIGTHNNGLSKIRFNNERKPFSFEHYSNKPNNLNSLNNNRIFSIEQDDEGNIWIGTFGGGINILKNHNVANKTQYIHLNKTSGLADNSIYGLINDKNGELWVSTDKGISRINGKTLEIKNYNETDGIQKGNFRRNAYHRGRSGKLYFGGIYGVTSFDPTKILTDTTAPKSFITSLYIQDIRILPNKKYNNQVILDKPIFQNDEIIKIQPSQRSFHFEFASTHYSHTKHNRYQYKMSGVVDKWRFTDRNAFWASFSNLPFGNYTFELRTITPEGIVGTNTNKVNIKILPPFYLTPLAFLIYALLIIAAIIIFNRVIIFRQQLKNDLKIEQIEKNKIKEVNKLKLRFFTNISHEFRTPLTLIIASLENIVKNKSLDRHAKENLHSIQINSNRILKLINQLMEFRRIEAGHLDFKTEKADLVYFLQELTYSFNEMAKKKNIQLVFNTENKHLVCNFDSDKVEKIFFNLLSNAFKNTPSGGRISFNIKIYEKDTEASHTDYINIIRHPLHRHIAICVEDTGCGIHKENIKKLFKRFYHSSNLSENLTVSTGIGLSLVKSLVNIHKGQLFIQSKENMGTSFIVKLPIDEILQGIEPEKTQVKKLPQLQNFLYVTDEEAKYLTHELPKIYSNLSNTNRPLLLIVEDNIEIKHILKQCFYENFEIIEASNGKEGVDQAVNRVPEIIISDVMMPEMDGFELTQILKTNIATNHIPIILLTAKDTNKSHLQGITKGADVYLPKPFNQGVLSAHVYQLLQSRKLLQEKYQNNNALPEKKTNSYTVLELKFLQDVEKIIENNLSNSEFVVANLEFELSLSRMQLYRKLKAIAGLSANEFIRDYRLRKAAILLSEGGYTISEIIYKTGFTNHSYFAKCFKQKYNKSPKEFAKDYEL